MLERLQVSGLGIIDEVTVELAAGFVAVTGETGAGKSLLVTSLELLAGRRASSELVRTGDATLRVQGWFAVDALSPVAAVLDEIGAADDDRLVIRRELTADGRGRCFVNDVAVTAATLQRLAPFLLSIHGQHEQHGLADGEVQRRLVDVAGGHDGLLAEVADRYAGWRAAAAELARLEAARAGRRDRLDVIAFQLGEIDAVAPVNGEVEELTARRSVLRNAARLGELATAVLGRLDDDDESAVERLARAGREVEEMVEHGLPLAEASAALGVARIQVEELVREIRRLTADLDGDPGELDVVESRLHALERLMLRYGEPLAAVLDHRSALLAERARLEDVEESLADAVMAADAALAVFAEAASRLDRARREAGERLAATVQGVLGSLNMAGTRLDFRWRARPEAGSPLVREGVAVAFDANGVEECELLIAANPGEEPRPMARIASGGELSRIHLAIRAALRRARPGPRMTLLFDEVDSGLGGATAAALGGLLAELATTDQVLAVTHLPQVAAAASSHLKVEKVNRKGRSVTRASVLDNAQRELELARMISGDELGESARAHARSLLERA
ncbi:MAG: DNA repair protein RecN [Thermoanaerobaculales bacterium]|jgi:DNA repair protein RecN (Recombination protein N)|nr:DNA repair protein RecN [Thermoanaerobaculales bacterium]